MEHEKELYDNLKPFLNCTDFTVSNEGFEVMLNKKYKMLVTSPVPTSLEEYYKSDAYISHTDSKKTFFDKIYQTVKNSSLKRKLGLINSFKNSDKTILDVGAGTGDFLKICKNNKWKVTGVEPNLAARKNAEKKGVHLKESLLEIKSQKFDVITLWHVLEHVENLKDYIFTLKQLLKEEGRLVIAVPNYKSYDANFYKEFWAAFDVPRHLWHFSQFSIHKLFNEAQMNVEQILPLKFDSYYVSLLSEKYKFGKMKPISAFFRGFISNFKAKTTSEYSSLIYVIKK